MTRSRTLFFLFLLRNSSAQSPLSSYVMKGIPLLVTVQWEKSRNRTGIHVFGEVHRLALAVTLA